MSSVISLTPGFSHWYLHKSEDIMKSMAFSPLLLTKEGGEGRGEISPNEFAHCAPERGAGTARPRALRFDGFAIWGRAVPTPVHGEEAVLLSFPSLRLSPHSFLAGREKNCIDTNSFSPVLAGPRIVKPFQRFLTRRQAVETASSFRSRPSPDPTEAGC